MNLLSLPVLPSLSPFCALSVCQLLLASALVTGASPSLADNKAGESHKSSWSWGSGNWGISYGEQTRGSGKVATERRAVSGFTSVGVSGSMKVTLVQGAVEGVSVSADDNIVPLIETTVTEGRNGKVLRIGPKKGTSYNATVPVSVTVELISLQGIAIAGSSDVSSAALKTGQLTVSISGSGDINLQQLSADTLSVAIAGSGDFRSDGRAQTVALKISGSGDVRAGGLDAEDVSVSIAGSGDAAVRASRSLKVAIAGSGDVTYSGNPTITKSVAGSGSVRQK